jgi:uncharacterized protein
MITAIYVVAMALFYIGYSWYLILLKRHARVHRVDWPMRHYDRASHGRNFVAQYTPLALLLLGVVELGGAPPVVLHGLGLLLAAAALLHCYSFGFPARMPPGTLAMVLVTGVYLGSSALVLTQVTGLGPGNGLPLAAVSGPSR